MSAFSGAGESYLMATYNELAGITAEAGFGALQNKVRVACAIKAVALLAAATPTASEVAWAKATLADPAAAGQGVLWYVIAANDSASIAQIVGASDAAVQANVDAAVDKITSV